VYIVAGIPGSTSTSSPARARVVIGALSSMVPPARSSSRTTTSVPTTIARRSTAAPLRMCR